MFGALSGDFRVVGLTADDLCDLKVGCTEMTQTSVGFSPQSQSSSRSTIPFPQIPVP